MASKVPIVSYYSEVGAKILKNVEGVVAALQDHGKFLDVCAGPATFSVAVLKEIGVEELASTEFIVSDFSVGMVEGAKVAMSEVVPPQRPNTQFIVYDVQNIELPSDSIDVVGCMFGYFVPDRAKAFGEICRVLKTNGTAVIGTWQRADFAYVLDDFLKFLGRTKPYVALKMAHVCADVALFQDELLGLGFRNVVIHTESKVFEMPLSGEVLVGLFNNPMVKNELAPYDSDFVQAEWAKFVRQTDFKYPIDLDQNILYVEYAANIAIATK